MSEPPVPPQPSYEELLAENAHLRAGLIQALAEVEELKARLGMTSKNSSKPPSSDGLTKPAPKSLRGKAKRGPGRPKGQMGFTLSPVDDPDHEQTYEPSACCGCGAGLDGAAVVGMERRQVFDLPPLRLEVTEHRLISRACSCGVITKAQAPAGVTAPVQYGSRLGGVGVYLFHGQFLSKSRTCQALADLFGAKIAASTLVSWVQRIAAQITSKVIPGIVDRIAGSAVAHFDETGFRAAGSLHWMHSASTPTDVLLSVHARRGVKGMDAAGVLPRFAGTAVHDAWAPYDTYTNATHALCNAHALRELIYVIDTAPPAVADLAAQGAEAMVAVKDLVEDARADDRHPDPDRMAAQRHLLRSAFVLGKSATAGRASKLERKYNSLFTRLIDRWEDYQRYTADPALRFDNNPAEQTIRMPKLRIKVSGCMRTLSGAEEFAAIRSYTATATRHGQNMLDVLIHAADSNPWIPDT
ncbi:MAG: IS66 family transposase [Actinobacteria bacterium]|nr:IS66 family transposase [Actinomycetota bacterium]